jgi:DNA-binding winged helix-turn-helix (wHTH) protein/tetratricopeptide (TPR) repeat protein
MNTHSSPLDGTVRFGLFEVDVRAGELRKSGIKIKLYGQPFEILLALLERPGKVVTREELRQRLWPPDVFVDVEVGLNKAVNHLREALGDTAENSRYVETLPRRGYRFVAPVDNSSRFLWPRKWLLVGSALALSATVAGAAVFLHFRSSRLLREGDTILLADFDNATGEAVFDRALKQGLSIQLEQSPFLNILPEARARQVLPSMRLSPDARLTAAITRDICVRRGLKAMVAGSIASLGAHYVISLQAVNCRTGESVGDAQVEVGSREQILTALGTAAAKLRARMGESLSSIQEFDRPWDTTTNSLEALESFYQGWHQWTGGDSLVAIPIFEHAIELDPDFPMAYAALGTLYYNIGEYDLAVAYQKKAFARKERVGRWEEFYISTHYHSIVTGDVEKLIDIYKEWLKTYPRAPVAFNNLTSLYNEIGQYEKALTLTPDYQRFHPEDPQAYAFAADALLGLNRYEEAKDTYEKAITFKLATLDCHESLYQIAFLKGDNAAMKRIASGCDDGVDGAYMLQIQANAAAFMGRLQEAKDRYRNATEMAQRKDLKEFAADLSAARALTDATFENSRQARNEAANALAIRRGRDARYLSAAALALSGDFGQAQKLSDELGREFPADTLLHSLTLPTVRAAIETGRGNPGKAIELLRPAALYELGSNLNNPTIVSFLAIYVRGQAYLQAREGTKAAGEFQKILDHRGVDLTSPLYPLAHLGLARARTLEGDTSNSKKSYEDFFAGWKDADPDIPILRKAMAEYAKLN